MLTMTGHKIQQTVFMLIGLAVGLWVGHQCTRILMRWSINHDVEKKVGAEVFKAESTSPSYQAVVEERVDESIKKSFTQPGLMDLVVLAVLYGVPGFFGLALGGDIAGPEPSA
jgi:hypothetical protein